MRSNPLSENISSWIESIVKSQARKAETLRMGVPKTPPKEAFERVRSLNVKRQIYEEAVVLANPFTMKVDEDVHQMVPREVTEEHVSFGHWDLQIPPAGTDSIGFFYVGQDRYFFNGVLNKKIRNLVIRIDADVFKLQRRKTLRATVPDDYPIFFLITIVEDKMSFIEAIVTDISGGGIRIVLPRGDSGTIKTNSKIRGTLRTPAGKMIEFEGQVRHIVTDPLRPEKKYFGIEMLKTNGISQRMMALTLEVQRRAVSGS